MHQAPRIALVGHGLVGRRHVRAMGAAGAELAAIVEPAPDGETPAPVFSSLDAMFEAEAPDAVILASPTPLHVEQALACIEREVPVLVEKPLAVTAAQGKRIVDAAAARNVPVLVGHHRRHNPLVAAAHEAVHTGRLGALRVAHAQCWFHKPQSYFDVALWRKQKGAGPVSVNLVHDVDLLRHLVGEIASVHARAAPSARGFENEDVAVATFAFENGALGTITVSDTVASPWSWELTAREHPIYPPTDQSCYLLGGTEASLSLPDLRLWSHESEPDWWSPIAATALLRDAADPLVRQIEHFARVVAGTEAPLVSAAEGLRTLRVIEAIETSAREGRTVELSGAD